jgi:hypothetical protein
MRKTQPRLQIIAAEWGLHVFHAVQIAPAPYIPPMPPDSSHLGHQLVWLLILSIPVACVAWTVTHEEVFREPREFCQEKCKSCGWIIQRKFFYLFTCEYCFSHYVTAFFLWLTHYHLLLDDWRGYVLAWFAVVWVANAYMNMFARLRVDLRVERAKADVADKHIEKIDRELSNMK